MRIRLLVFSSPHWSEYLCSLNSFLYFSHCILSGFLCFYTLLPCVHSFHNCNISFLLPLHNLMNNDLSFRIYNKLFLFYYYCYILCLFFRSCCFPFCHMFL